ncbi:MAG: M48 family metalloprotease [Burkholderiaceae bacterium]
MHPTNFAAQFWSRRVIASMLCVSLAFLPWSRAVAVETLPSLGDPASDELSPLAERKLGEDIMRQAREADDIFDDPESTEYLNQFGLNLILHAPPSPQPIEFFLVLDPDINAFALPGGYIGVNTGLIIATESESELASVMSHEMGHVIQRHIARGMDRASQTGPLAIAAMLLGLLAAAKAHSADAGEAAIAGGAGFAISDQLAFSREAEREADRVGFQILQDSGFDVAGMATFFQHLQTATRIYDSGAPEWLRDHPVTSERIADIQGRIKDSHYHQRPDSLDFYLIRARLRVLQNITVQGLRDTQVAFEDQLKHGAYANEASIHYGMAVDLLRQDNLVGAQKELEKVQKLVPNPDPVIVNFQITLKRAQKDFPAALALAETGSQQFPQSRSLAWKYAEVLQDMGRQDDAIAFLRDQISQYSSEYTLYALLAKSYTAKGEIMLEHKALAEEYYRRGSVQAAIEQLNLAHKEGSSDFYEMSQIDARLAQLKSEWADIQKQRKQNRTGT